MQEVPVQEVPVQEVSVHEPSEGVWVLRAEGALEDHTAEKIIGLYENAVESLKRGEGSQGRGRRGGAKGEKKRAKPRKEKG